VRPKPSTGLLAFNIFSPLKSKVEIAPMKRDEYEKI